MLGNIFALQMALNDHVFKKQDIRDNDGHRLTMGGLFAEAEQARLNTGQAGAALGPSSNVNTWLRKFLEADADETRELSECLLWKWWSKDFLDLHNIRVEIVDKLHFLVSLAIAAGLTSEELYRLYAMKNTVNLARQASGYNQAVKTEDDNQGVK